VQPCDMIIEFLNNSDAFNILKVNMYLDKM